MILSIFIVFDLFLATDNPVLSFRFIQDHFLNRIVFKKSETQNKKGSGLFSKVMQKSLDFLCYTDLKVR